MSHGQQLPEGELALTVTNTETGTFVITATDTRGYTTALTVEKPVVPYERITCNASVKRTDPTSGNALLKVSGNYWPGNFGAAENTLTLTYSIDHGAAQEISPEILEGTYAAELVISGLSYDAQHTVTVTAKDRVDQVGASLQVKKGIPLFDWGEKDFRFHIPVAFDAGFNMTIDAEDVFHEDVRLSEIWPVYLTQAEYDALVSAGEMNPNTHYVILPEG